MLWQGYYFLHGGDDDDDGDDGDDDEDDDGDDDDGDEDDDEDDDEDGEDNGVEIWRWFGAFWPVVRRFRPVSAKN